MLALSCCVGFSLVAVHGFFTVTASLVVEHRLWSTWAQKLGCSGLAVLWHAESFQTRDQTCVSCVGRWILYHWAIREALSLSSDALSSHQETFVSGFTALAVY